MSKTTDDLITRIEGEVVALKGVKVKLSPSAPATNPPDPATQVSQEDYAHAKQIIAELKGNVEQLEAEVARDSKVPGEHSDTKSSAGKTKSSI